MPTGRRSASWQSWKAKAATGGPLDSPRGKPLDLVRDRPTVSLRRNSRCSSTVAECVPAATRIRERDRSISFARISKMGRVSVWRWGSLTRKVSLPPAALPRCDRAARTAGARLAGGPSGAIGERMGMSCVIRRAFPQEPFHAIANSKSESRNPEQIRVTETTMIQTPGPDLVVWRIGCFGIGALFRISSFGFRIWVPVSTRSSASPSWGEATGARL